MSQDKTKSNVIDLMSSTPIVEIKLHPKEILDLDEETVAIARAKLAGIDFAEIYGDEDRSSPGLMIRTQAQKIRDLFQTPDELRRAFSSPKKTEEAQKDMMIDGIDLDFVRSYCQKNQIKFENDMQALINIGFANERAGEANV